jgi:hypothetical protein
VIAIDTTHLIDEAILRRLIRELGGDVVAGARFATDFVAAWDGRVANLHDAVDRNDPEDVATALLSIQTSSAMLGATLLFSAATELRQQLRTTRRVDAVAVDRLVQLGVQTCRELTAVAGRLTLAAA